MSIYSMTNDHKNMNNAEKIAEIINNSDDINFKKDLLPTLEKYSENSNGLFDDKQLSHIRKSINDEDWSY